MLLHTACDSDLAEPLGTGISLLPPTSLAHASGDGDHDALVALYNATGGPDWTRNDDWLSDKPLRDWYGITSDSAGRVIAVGLSDNGLEGVLPAALGRPG